MERFCVLQVLYEQGDPVVVGELVEDVGDVEGGCLDEQQENVTIFTRGLAENLTIVLESGCECDCSAEGETLGQLWKSLSPPLGK